MVAITTSHSVSPISGAFAKEHRAILLRMAGKYIWWMTAEEALEYPARIIAQVMNIGLFRDYSELLDSVGEEAFRSALTHAEPGQFNPMAWHYWHYRLEMAELGLVPTMPIRVIPGANLPNENFHAKV